LEDTKTTEFPYDQLDDDALEAAKIAIHNELASLVGFPSANLNDNPQQLREGFKFLNPYRGQQSDLLAYDTATESWKEASSLSLDSCVAGYSHLLRTIYLLHVNSTFLWISINTRKLNLYKEDL
jgi:pre-mRNA-splicing factor CDC5/CEF1